MYLFILCCLKHSHYITIKEIFMKKKYLLLLLLSIIILKGFSQQVKPDLTKEQFKEGKYLVKIIPVGDNGYGYEILDGSKIITRQEYIPYFLIPIPFSKIENIKKVAIWHISQLKEKNEIRLVLSQQKAREIGISEEDLTTFKHTN